MSTAIASIVAPSTLAGGRARLSSSPSCRARPEIEISRRRTTRVTTWRDVSSRIVTTRASSSSSSNRTYRTGDAERPAPPEGFGVVITGATKGVGYALAREFLMRGDRVCICGRSATRVDAAVAALRAEFPGACVAGTRCDVTDPRDVDAFGDYAAATVGVIHHWLNNAGMVSSRQPLFDIDPSEVVRVCNTNLTGAILCCQKAVKLMRRQGASGTGGSGEGSASSSNNKSSSQRYHVYNFGFSRWGASFSKSTCTHKATKRGLSQLTSALSEELTEAGVECVGVHQLSPGMVLTDLLLEGASPVARRFFNVLAEEPEVVAADLCPKIRAVRGTNSSIEFLTLPDAVRRVATGVPQIVGGGRFFDSNGNRIASDGALGYKENGTRLLYEGME
jgi:NAD(P)-dependent dehydrogenase (short-subunit alcohol dehydrogenase family)